MNLLNLLKLFWLRASWNYHRFLYRILLEESEWKARIRRNWKNLNRNLVTLEEELRLKRTRSLPYSLIIDTTTKCNLRCITCFREFLDFNLNEVPDMNREVLEDLVECFFPTAASLNMSLIGEPLASPHLDYLIEAMKRHDVKLGFTTNGTLLHKLDIGARIAPILGSIEFSIDSLDSDRFETIRSGAKFRQVVANFDLMARFRNESGPNPFRLGISTTILSSNLDEFCHLIEFVADHGGNFIRACIGVVYREEDVHLSVLNKAEDYNRMYIEAHGIAQKRGVELSMPAPFLADHDQDRIEKGRCQFLYNTLRISHEGIHTVCLHGEPPAQNEYVRGRPFRIWNHRDVVKIRKNYDKPSGHASCRNCYIVNRGLNTISNRRKQFLPYLNNE